jgi:hypothetical protein
LSHCQHFSGRPNHRQLTPVHLAAICALFGLRQQRRSARRTSGGANRTHSSARGNWGHRRTDGEQRRPASLHMRSPSLPPQPATSSRHTTAASSYPIYMTFLLVRPSFQSLATDAFPRSATDSHHARRRTARRQAHASRASPPRFRAFGPWPGLRVTFCRIASATICHVFDISFHSVSSYPSLVPPISPSASSVSPPPSPVAPGASTPLRGVRRRVQQRRSRHENPLVPAMGTRVRDTSPRLFSCRHAAQPIRCVWFGSAQRSMVRAQCLRRAENPPTRKYPPRFWGLGFGNLGLG